MARFTETQQVTDVLPRYAEMTSQGRVFYAATQAVATLTVGLATTYTGLCVSNPVGNNYDLILMKASFMQSVIQATQVEAYAIATGWHASTNVTHTAAASVYSAYVNNAPATNSSTAKADTQATLPTAPVYTHFMHNTGTATANGTGITNDLEGSIILGPGAYAVITAPAQASVAGIWFSLSWMELPTRAAQRLGFQG